MIIRIPNARLSFPELFNATSVMNGPMCYRASFLVDEHAEILVSDGAGGWKKNTIPNLISEMATEKWKAKAKQNLDSMKNNPQKCCWYDGNIKSFDGYEGKFVLSATRKAEDGRPVVVDAGNQPLAEGDGKPYAGCYVMASVDLWIQDNDYGKGIRATLRGVVFQADGDAFSGSSRVTQDEFSDLSAEAAELI